MTVSDEEFRKLEQRVGHLQSAALSAAAVLIHYQTLLSEISETLSGEDFERTRLPADEARKRIDRMLDQISEAIDAGK